MRLIVLILSPLFMLDLHAQENWASVKFNDTDAGASAPAIAADTDAPQPLLPVEHELKTRGFSIYFLQKSHCLPVMFVEAQQQITGLQLRIDEREIYRPQCVKHKEDIPFAQAMFVDADPTEEQIQEDLRVTKSFLRDISEGDAIRVKLEPSGKVRRWSLRGSKTALDAAMKHCLASVEDQRYFSEVSWPNKRTRWRSDALDGFVLNSVIRANHSGIFGWNFRMEPQGDGQLAAAANASAS